MVVLASHALARKSAGFQPPVRKQQRCSRDSGIVRFSDPEGYVRCTRCIELIDTSAIEDGIACCANGHSYDVDAIMAEAVKGPMPRSGLSKTQMGKLGEHIISTYARNLGEYGYLVGEDKPYKGSLDYITTRRGGVEVKTVDKECTLAFQYGKPAYRLAKDAALVEYGCDFALMVLAVIDFRSLTATIYIRRDSRFKYWQLALSEPVFQIVAFELPAWAEAVVGGASQAAELMAAASTDNDMPF